MSIIHRFSSKIALIAIMAIIAHTGMVPPVKSAGFINAASQLWEEGMPWWADSIAVEPGKEFKIYLSAGNYSETGAVVTSAIIKHNLPTITLPGGGTQAVAYVPGSTFYYYDSSGNWSAFSDDGTSAFDNAGLSVTTDSSLNPFEGANYKYTVRIPDTLPAGTSSLNWTSPVLSFSISGVQYSVASENSNSVTIENLPSITNFSINKTQFSSGDSISVTASGTSGLSPRVEIGSITTINLTEMSSGQYVGAYVLPNSIVQSGITPRLYMVNNQGKGSYLNYGSSISINTTAASQPTPASASSGGGGARAVYAPFVSNSSGDLQKKGDKVSVSVSSGSQAAVFLKSDATIKANITVSALTAKQSESVPMSQAFGVVLWNNIFSVIQNNGGNFPSNIELTLTYAADQIKSCPAKDLILAHHQLDLERWVALASTANEKNMSITAPIKEEGYYAIACFAGGEDEAEGIDLEDGFILGTSVGAYSNGSLLRSAGSSEVWHISADQRHWAPSVQIFESQFNWNDVIDLPSPKQLDLYSRGIDVFFPTGTLIKETGSSDTYRVSSNRGLQPILSSAVFAAMGYRTDMIKEVPAGSLKAYSLDAYIDSADNLHTGDIVKTADKNSVYYVEGSILRPIPSYDIFIEHKFMLSSVRVVSKDLIAKYGIGASLPYPDGTLVKGSRTSVYVMSDQKKRPIFSHEDFEALLYDWDKIIFVPDALLEDVETGAVVKILE